MESITSPLLDLIFGYINERQRLLVVEHVCTRWRSLSLAGAGWIRMGPELTVTIDPRWMSQLGTRLNRTRHMLITPLEISSTHSGFPLGLHLKEFPRLKTVELILASTGGIVEWSLASLTRCTDLIVIRKPSSEPKRENQRNLWGLGGFFPKLHSLTVQGHFMPDFFCNWSAPLLKELHLDAIPKYYHLLFRGCRHLEILTLRLPSKQWEGFPPLALLSSLSSLRSLTLLEPTNVKVDLNLDVLAHHLHNLPASKMKCLSRFVLNAPSYGLGEESLKVIFTLPRLEYVDIHIKYASMVDDWRVLTPSASQIKEVNIILTERF